MDAGKLAEVELFTAESPAHEEVEIAEAPGDKSEARNAEEAIEDLGVIFDPLFPGAVDGVAAWVAHGWGCVEEDKEDHGAPGDDIETV